MFDALVRSNVPKVGIILSVRPLDAVDQAGGEEACKLCKQIFEDGSQSLFLPFLSLTKVERQAGKGKLHNFKQLQITTAIRLGKGKPPLLSVAPNRGDDPISEAEVVGRQEMELTMEKLISLVAEVSERCLQMAG